MSIKSDKPHALMIEVIVVRNRDVPQWQWVPMATAVLTEREWPLHPFPVQLLLSTVAIAVND